jgi:hypothetical protein
MTKHGKVWVEDGRVLHDELRTSVETVSYDFLSCKGALRMPEYCCCGMDGCIRLFQRIDSRVKEIWCWAADKLDIIYVRTATDWTAVDCRGYQINAQMSRDSIKRSLVSGMIDDCCDH